MLIIELNEEVEDASEMEDKKKPTNFTSCQHHLYQQKKQLL